MKRLFKPSLSPNPSPASSNTPLSHPRPRERGRRLPAAILLSLFCTPTMADGIVVVPAKNAGYLYNPSGDYNNVEEISLHLIKEGGFTNYSIESDPPGFLCDESCPETVQRLPSGRVTLLIKGNKPFPLLKIPLRGQWTEGCDDSTSETDKCIMNLNETNSRVTLTVDPNVVAGTLLTDPSDDKREVMFIKADSARGYAIVAAHRALGKNKTWFHVDLSRISSKQKLGAVNPSDGTGNTERLAGFGAEAASYCKNLYDSSGWYLPARAELEPINRDALKKIIGLDNNDRLWTSTESSIGTHRGRVYFEAMTLNVSSANISNNSDYLTCPPDATSASQCNNYRYQTLCVKRLPL